MVFEGCTSLTTLEFSGCTEEVHADQSRGCTSLAEIAVGARTRIDPGILEEHPGLRIRRV